MSSSTARNLGENIANKVASGMRGGLKGPAQPAKLNKRGTKSQNSKAVSAGSTGTSGTKTSLTAKNAAAKKNPDGLITNAPRSLVLSLYKQLLRRSRSLEYTSSEYFARRMHQEFMKRKDVKDNNLYYIRGKWMLENNMGGLL